VKEDDWLLGVMEVFMYESIQKVFCHGLVGIIAAPIVT